MSSSDHFEKRDREEKRGALYLWIAEMLIGTLFILPAAAQPTCRGSVFYGTQFFLMMNFVVPIIFVIPAVLAFVVGDVAGVKRLLTHVWETISGSYKGAPTLTILLVGLVAWTFYCTTMRYHWSSGYANPDNIADLTTVSTVTDNLTGAVNTRVFSFDQCYQEMIDEQNSDR